MQPVPTLHLAPLLLACFGIFLCPAAKASAFEKNADDYMRHVNSIGEWSNGVTYQVTKAWDCGQKGLTSEEIYTCHVNYEMKSDLGTKTCINGMIAANQLTGEAYIYSSVDFSGNFTRMTGECGDWREDMNQKGSLRPDIQNNAPSDSRFANIPAPSTEITLKDYHLLIGGASVFVVGGVSGILLSKVIGKK